MNERGEEVDLQSVFVGRYYGTLNHTQAKAGKTLMIWKTSHTHTR